MPSHTPPLESRPGQFPNRLALYFAATRPPFLVAAATPVAIGLAYHHADTGQLNLALALLTLLGAVLVHAAVNVLNDYYDELNGTDRANTTRVYPFTGGSRFIQNGVLTAAQTARFGVILLLLTGMIGGLLMAASGYGLALIGLLGFVIGWGYSAPPLQLNSRGLGELSVGLGFGLLIPWGADYVQRGDYALFAALAGLPYGLLAANLLLINQFPDCEADRQAGKHHWVVRLGPARAPWLYLAIASLAYLSLVALILTNKLPMSALLALLPAPLSAIASRQLFLHATQPAQLAPAIQLTISAAILHGVLLVVALWL